MIKQLIMIFLVAHSYAQVIKGGVTVSGGVAVGSTVGIPPPPPPGPVQLPTLWVNNHECDPPGGIYDVTKTIGVDYPNTLAGLNQSMTDWAAAADQWWHVVVPHGTVYSGVGNAGGFNNGVFLIKTKLIAGVTLPLKCIVYESDTPLVRNRPVCGRGIQDNLAPATNIFTRNTGCTSPNDVASMWTVEYTGAGGNGIGTAAPVSNIGPSRVMFRDLEVRPSTSNTSPNTLVRLGAVQGGDTLATQLPSHIHFDGVYLHGDTVVSGGVITGHGNNSISAAGIVLNCEFCSFMNSQIDRIWRNGNADYQLILMSNSIGPVKIVNDILEGGTEPILCGGSVPQIPGIVSCNDVEIRRIRVYRPTETLNELGGASTPPNSWWYKNLIELKEGQRVLIDGSIFENNDNVGGQGGPGPVINVRACSAGLHCNNTAATIKDFTWSNNITRGTCRVGGGDGQTGGGSAGIEVGFGGQSWLFSNDLFYNAQQANWGGTALGCKGSDPANGFNINSNGFTWSTSTATRTAGIVTYTLLPGGSGQDQGNFNIGDPVYVQGCADTSFNTTVNTLGPLAISPTDPTTNQVTVVLAGTGTSTTGCQVTNRQSYPRNMILQHDTVIAEATAFNPTSTNGTSALIFAKNNTFRDSIFTGGGWNTQGNGIAEGTQEENKMWDSSTLTVNHVIFPQRPSTKYTQYPEGFDFSVVTACTSPGVPGGCIGSMYFPVLNNDIKFKATFGLNLADWHNYALDPTSTFHNAGSDGTDIGVIIPAIDAAQTATQYTCQTACGTGPFAD